MRSIPDQELESVFKEAAAGYKAEFDPKAWGELESRLDKVSPTTSGKYQRPLLLLLLLLSMGVVVYWGTHQYTGSTLAPTEVSRVTDDIGNISGSENQSEAGASNTTELSLAESFGSGSGEEGSEGRLQNEVSGEDNGDADQEPNNSAPSKLNGLDGSANETIAADENKASNQQSVLIAIDDEDDQKASGDISDDNANTSETRFKKQKKASNGQPIVVATDGEDDQKANGDINDGNANANARKAAGKKETLNERPSAIANDNEDNQNAIGDTGDSDDNSEVTKVASDKEDSNEQPTTVLNDNEDNQNTSRDASEENQSQADRLDKKAFLPQEQSESKSALTEKEEKCDTDEDSPKMAVHGPPFLQNISPDLTIGPGEPVSPEGVTQEIEAVSSPDIVKDDKTAYKRGLSLLLSLAPDYSSAGFFQPDRLGSNFGLSGEYRLSRRFGIESGAIISRKIYFYDEESLDGGPYGPVGSELNVDGICQVLDIPINLNYYAVTRNNNSLFISAGVSTYLMLEEDYDYQVTNNGDIWSRSERFVNENNHFFGVFNFSIGYEQRIRPNLWIQIEPFVKAPWTGVGNFDVNLVSSGAFVNLKYTLGK
ncbi:MAG: hypothetical protein AAFX87_25030 [Bacteroidota bacterium]